VNKRINQLLTWLLTMAALLCVASSPVCQPQTTNVADDPQAVRFAVAHQHASSWCFGYLYVSPTAISYVVTTPATSQQHSFTFQRSQISSVMPWTRDQQTLKAVRIAIGNTAAYHFWWMPNEGVVQTGRPYQWNPPDAADPQQLIATILGPNGLPTAQQGAGAGLQPGALGTGPGGPQGTAPGLQDPLVSSAANALGSGTNPTTPAIGGRMGLRLTNLTLQKSTSLGLSATSGALVEALEANGPAERAGVRIDDVITTFNDAPIGKPRDVQKEERRLARGSIAELQILRNSQLVKVRVKMR